VRRLPLMMWLGLLAPAAAIADEPVNTLVVYVLGIGIDGQARVGPLTADIDVSVEQVFENLEFGAMGSYRRDGDSWSFQIDAMYASLAGEKEGSRGLAKATLDLDQIMIEVDGGYQLSDNVELMAGARYWDIEAEIGLHGAGPVGAVRRTEGGDSWVDPLIGLRVSAPLGENWTFGARGDVGGFGVGADLAWHATVQIGWRINQRFSMLFGYRIFDLDFEDGGGANRTDIDLQESGPGIGAAFSF
jgi:hypothetical protein